MKIKITENDTDEAIEIIAQEALKRKTGARALRSILETLMMDIMYEVPSDSSIKEFTVTADMVKKPEILLSLMSKENKQFSNKIELKKLEKVEKVEEIA